MFFRIDRLITLGFVSPALKILPPKKINYIPILMYHSISDSSFPEKHPYFQTHTLPEVFQAHMDVLKNNGYVVIDLKTAVEIVFSGKTNVINYVVLTFDDAYKDFMTHAFPVLEDHCFTATVFVPSGLVGKKSNRLLNKICLSWEELFDLSQAGIEIGSHTVSHSNLALLKQEEIMDELSRSKDEIESKLNQEIVSFSYPYAFPQANKDFLCFYERALSKCGYLYGVTTKIGLASSEDGVYTLKRVPVNDFDDEILFRTKLTGGYDWMSIPQRIIKTYKALKRDSGNR